MSNFQRVADLWFLSSRVLGLYFHTLGDIHASFFLKSEVASNAYKPDPHSKCHWEVYHYELDIFFTKISCPLFCVFRWVLCANHTEPVKGFLGRYLRRKLIEMEIERSTRSNDLVKIIDWIPKTWRHLNRFLETHSSFDVTIGESRICNRSFSRISEYREDCQIV